MTLWMVRPQGTEAMCPHLGVPELVLVVVYVNGPQELLGALAAVDELPLGDGSRVQDAVPGGRRRCNTPKSTLCGVVHPLSTPSSPCLLPLTEVPIEDAVGEALAAYADALQHPVAAELVHHQGVVHHTWWH